MDIELQFRLLNDKLNKYLNDLEKSNKTRSIIKGVLIFILSIMCLLSMSVIFLSGVIPVLADILTKSDKGMNLLIYSIINIITTVISIKLVETVFSTIPADYTEHKNAIHTLLAEHLNVSVKSVEYELNAFIHGMKTKHGLEIIDNFYTDLDQFMLVYERLAKNLKKDITEEKILDLKVEQAQLNVQKTELQNEGIKIDNDLKNFWECKYCGSANYGNEKKCSSCGATRLVIKLKSRNEV